MRFRHKYLSSLHYKNYYITETFLNIDATRIELGMESLLPLTYKEKKYLVELTSSRTIWKEWHHMFSSSITLTYSTFHLLGILLADYSLFWLLSVIEFYGNQTAVNDSETEG